MAAIQSRPIVEEMRESFAGYAMSVITDRALPDVRDGLKPVQRRILFAMSELGLSPTRAYKKCATVVGDVLGKYHPHGDSSVYQALVRLAQDFSMRYPLIDGQGNFGSVDGDAAAAYRYTEARLTPASMALLDGMDEAAVPMTVNYDGRLEEPSVLPAGLPALLINGSTGIAVGMATNCVPHNAREVIKACLALLADAGCSDADLRRHVKGPDFPTAGIIIGRAGITTAQLTGKGSVIVRGRVVIEDRGAGKQAIIITELPYQVNKEKLVQEIAELHGEKKLEGITALRDESDRDGMRVVIELKRDTIAARLVERLYKLTKLQVALHISQVALTPDPATGRPVPRLHTLRDLITAYLAHRRVVLLARTQFRLDRAAARAHIVEGLLVAVANIDAVVALIKAAADVPSAHAELMRRFLVDDIQAEAILALRLARLAALEVQELKAEGAALAVMIAGYHALIASPDVQTSALRAELEAAATTVSDSRRTQIVAEDDAPESQEPEPAEVRYVWRTTSGRVGSRSVAAAARATKGAALLAAPAGARADGVVASIAVGGATDTLMIVTAAGHVHGLYLSEVPELASGGTPFVQVVPKADPTVVTTSLLPPDTVDGTLVMVTARGMVKRTALSEFQYARHAGVRGMAVAAGDRVVFAAVVSTDSPVTPDLTVATAKGQVLRFTLEEVRPMGRDAAGVKSIALGTGDTVVAAVVSRERGSAVVVVADTGIVTSIAVKDVPRQARGGKGVALAGLGRAGVRDMIARDTAQQLGAVMTDGRFFPLEWDAVPLKARTAAFSRPGVWTQAAPVQRLALVPLQLPVVEDHS